MPSCSPAIGTRIVHTLTGKAAVVVGASEPSASCIRLVPVILEGSTRRELWATHQIRLRPRREQCEALGGAFKPPLGYPLIAR